MLNVTVILGTEK